MIKVGISVNFTIVPFLGENVHFPGLRRFSPVLIKVPVSRFSCFFFCEKAAFSRSPGFSRFVAQVCVPGLFGDGRIHTRRQVIGDEGFSVRGLQRVIILNDPLTTFIFKEEKWKKLFLTVNHKNKF